MAAATIPQKKPRPHRQRTQLVNKHQETVLAVWFGAVWLAILGLTWLVLGDTDVLEWSTSVAYRVLQASQ